MSLAGALRDVTLAHFGGESSVCWLAARFTSAPKIAEPKSGSLSNSQLLVLLPSSLSHFIPTTHFIHYRQLHLTFTPHHIITMFPRRFAQSMQAAAKQSSAATARVQRSAFVSQQFAPAMSQRLSGMRMYSDAPAAEAKKTEEASAEKDAKVEEDPVKAELETKKKELLEATVRLYHSDGKT
jgi:hypothetical protein